MVPSSARTPAVEHRPKVTSAAVAAVKDELEVSRRDEAARTRGGGGGEGVDGRWLVVMEEGGIERGTRVKPGQDGVELAAVMGLVTPEPLLRLGEQA